MQVTSSMALDLTERLLVKHKIKLTVDVIYVTGFRKETSHTRHEQLQTIFVHLSNRFL